MARALFVVVLIGCSGDGSGGGIPDEDGGTRGVADGGVDAGRDTGVAEPNTVSIAYTYGPTQGSCEGALRDCVLATPNDGGWTRWVATYHAVYGCTVDAGTIDCRARCDRDAGQSTYGCCGFDSQTIHTQRDACSWNPP